MPPARWTQEAIIGALRRDARRRGRPLRQRDWARTASDRPTYEAVRVVFGSWSRGLAAAGLEARPPANVRPNRCARGHELAAGNVWVRKDGARLCLTCKQRRDRETMERWRRRGKPGYCRRGHRLTGDNVIVTSAGDRQCRTCKRAADARAKRRARAARRTA